MVSEGGVLLVAATALVVGGILGAFGTWLALWGRGTAPPPASPTSPAPAADRPMVAAIYLMVKDIYDWEKELHPEHKWTKW